MNKADLAWRGFTCEDGSVIAWPMLLMDHSEFHRQMHTTDADFIGRWRQWSPGGRPDIDPGHAAGVPQLVQDWLAS